MANLRSGSGGSGGGSSSDETSSSSDSGGEPERIGDDRLDAPGGGSTGGGGSSSGGESSGSDGGGDDAPDRIGDDRLDAPTGGGASGDGESSDSSTGSDSEEDSDAPDRIGDDRLEAPSGRGGSAGGGQPDDSTDTSNGGSGGSQSEEAEGSGDRQLDGIVVSDDYGGDVDSPVVQQRLQQARSSLQEQDVDPEDVQLRVTGSGWVEADGLTDDAIQERRREARRANRVSTGGQLGEDLLEQEIENQNPGVDVDVGRSGSGGFAVDVVDTPDQPTETDFARARGALGERVASSEGGDMGGDLGIEELAVEQIVEENENIEPGDIDTRAIEVRERDASGQLPDGARRNLREGFSVEFTEQGEQRLREQQAARQEEQFGDIDWSFGLGGEGDEVESAVEDASDWYTENVGGAAADIAESDWFQPDTSGNAVGEQALTSDDANNSESVDSFYGTAGRTVAELGNLPGYAKTAMEGAEYVGYAGSQDAGTTARETGSEIAERGSRAVDFAIENPSQAAGVGFGALASLPASAGGFRAIGSVSPRAARAADVVTDPWKLGREGVRGARRFAADDRGQQQLSQIGRSRSTDSEDAVADGGQQEIVEVARSSESEAESTLTNDDDVPITDVRGDPDVQMDLLADEVSRGSGSRMTGDELAAELDRMRRQQQLQDVRASDVALETRTSGTSDLRRSQSSAETSTSTESSWDSSRLQTDRARSAYESRQGRGAEAEAEAGREADSRLGERTAQTVGVSQTVSAGTEIAAGDELDAVEVQEEAVSESEGMMRSLEAETQTMEETDVGVEQGVEQTMEAGQEFGVETGFEVGSETGFEVGTESGAEAGVETGVETGFEYGVESGVETGFEGEMESEDSEEAWGEFVSEERFSTGFATAEELEEEFF